MKIGKLLHITFITCVSLLFLSRPATSFAYVDLKSISTDKLTYINQIEAYLNNLKNLKANFSQSYQGSVSSGTFYLSRPGKMRVEYDRSQNILITVNGPVLTYKDLDLDEISNLSTNTTPASFLTRKNISFRAKDIIIDSLKISKDEVSVAVIKKNRPEAGKFRIVFDSNISYFKRLEVINDSNESVLVKLHNISYPDYLPSDLFYIKNKNLPF